MANKVGITDAFKYFANKNTVIFTLERNINNSKILLTLLKSKSNGLYYLTKK